MMSKHIKIVKETVVHKTEHVTIITMRAFNTLILRNISLLTINNCFNRPYLATEYLFPIHILYYSIKNTEARCFLLNLSEYFGLG